MTLLVFSVDCASACVSLQYSVVSFVSPFVRSFCNKLLFSHLLTANDGGSDLTVVVEDNLKADHPVFEWLINESFRMIFKLLKSGFFFIISYATVHAIFRSHRK